MKRRGRTGDSLKTFVMSRGPDPLNAIRGPIEEKTSVPSLTIYESESRRQPKNRDHCRAGDITVVAYLKRYTPLRN